MQKFNTSINLQVITHTPIRRVVLHSRWRRCVSASFEVIRQPYTLNFAVGGTADTWQRCSQAADLIVPDPVGDEAGGATTFE